MRQWFWGIAAAVVALDQATKLLVVSLLPEGHPSVALIPRLLYLTHVRNPGTAFGLLPRGGIVLSLIAVAAIVGIVVYWRRLRKRPDPPPALLVWGLALPLGGAVGNLLDRMRAGAVIDFIDLRFWPVFNVADSAITVGACLIGWYFLFVADRPRRAAEAGRSTPLPPGSEGIASPSDPAHE